MTECPMIGKDGRIKGVCCCEQCPHHSLGSDQDCVCEQSKKKLVRPDGE